MSEEEAIEYIEQFIGIKKEYKCKPIKVKTLNNTREAIETALNLLEKKDKQIDLMSNYICCMAYDKIIKKLKEDDIAYYGIEGSIKQYFERKVENGN